jgi:hypothetical protein
MFLRFFLAVFIGNELIETTSSERYKENIRPLEDVSERVMRVEPVRYIGKGVCLCRT